LTEQVVGAIEPELLIGEGHRALSKGTENLDAYECCMRGLWHHYRTTLEHLDKSIGWQRRAIELDPSLARAYMALARSL